MRFLFSLLFVFALGAAAMGCGHTPLPGASTQRVLLAYDDGHAAGKIVFPNVQYESIIRFELPPGERRLLRLWLQAGGMGKLAVTFYETNILEGPGAKFGSFSRDLAIDDISDGRDDRWVVQDVTGLPGVKGIIWVGIKAMGGAPIIWSSHVVSGRYYLRSDVSDLLPVKETPMVRLEVSP